MSDARPRWSADEEIIFLRGLALSAPEACLNYCWLLLSDGRRWDAEVDIAAVKAEAARLIGPLSGLPARAAL